MPVKPLMSELRRCFSGVSLGAALAAFCAGPLIAQDADDSVVVTNSGRFEIPFEVEAEPGSTVEGFAVLFGSQDSGKHWEQLQTVPAARGAFLFSAARDGHYSFAFRMTDAQGNLQSSIEGSSPEMDVIVDTVAPKLQLEIIEAAPGQAIINWNTVDSNVAPESMTLEYVEGLSGQRKPIVFTPGAAGQARLTVASGAMVAIVASISDAAGNRGEASAQLVTRPAPTAQPTLPGTFAANGPSSAASLGLSPFNGLPSAGGAPGSFGPVSGAPQFMKPPGIPAATAVYPGEMSAGSIAGTVMAGTGMQGTSFFAPVSQTNEHQLVNERVFDLDYQIEDVGPSGVSAVELFVTEDGGQQWFRYGSDADLKSPFQVDSMGEGTFGFAVRIRNGLGIADPPPQPGQTPEIVVTVDQTPPVIEMAQPAVRMDSIGMIQLGWKISEPNPAAASVRLEHAIAPNGPWTPVFDWQADQGGFQVAIRPGTPSSLYFRLLARDAAGNVATTQTSQPVVVDLKRPVGRILRVQPASHSLSSGVLP